MVIITIDHNTNAWYNYYQNEAPKPAAERNRFLASVAYSHGDAAFISQHGDCVFYGQL